MAGGRNPAARKGVLVTGRAGGYKRFDKAGARLGHEVNYYAHTAVRSDGTPDPNPAKWQLLSTKKGGLRKPRMEVIVPTFRQQRLGSSQPIMAARLVLIRALHNPKPAASSTL